MFNSIDHTRLDAAKTALRLVFNVEEPDDISALTGGYSTSAIYKLNVKNRSYVLRIMGLDQILADRQQQIECFQLAGSVNVTPHCLYADAENGIIIMDFIQNISIPEPHYFVQQIATTLRRLHSVEKFPLLHDSIPDFIAGVEKFLHTHPMSELLRDYFILITEIRYILSPYLTNVSCHNDLHPNNVLFDGKQLYLIDWEAAGPNDPFFDLAAVCNMFDDFVFEKVTGEELLNAYLDKTPTALQQAKLLLMRQISYHFYASLFLEAAVKDDKSLLITDIDSWPTLRVWTYDYNNGKTQLTTKDDFILYAMALIKTSLELMSTRKFEMAKNLLAKHN